MKKCFAALAVLCLLLSGCFKSQGLLWEPSESSHPIADGSWSSAKQGVMQENYDLRVNGWGYDNLDSDTTALAMRRLESRNAYIVARADGGCLDHPGDCEWSYAVVAFDGERAREYLPDCNSQWSAIEQDADSRDEDGNTCTFTSLAGLDAALSRTLDSSDPIELIHSVPAAN